jgi:hypothetical protein
VHTSRPYNELGKEVSYIVTKLQFSGRTCIAMSSSVNIQCMAYTPQINDII